MSYCLQNSPLHGEDFVIVVVAPLLSWVDKQIFNRKDGRKAQNDIYLIWDVKYNPNESSALFGYLSWHIWISIWHLESCES